MSYLLAFVFFDSTHYLMSVTVTDNVPVWLHRFENARRAFKKAGVIPSEQVQCCNIMIRIL